MRITHSAPSILLIFTCRDNEHSSKIGGILNHPCGNPTVDRTKANLTGTVLHIRLTQFSMGRRGGNGNCLLGMDSRPGATSGLQPARPEREW